MDDLKYKHLYTCGSVADAGQAAHLAWEFCGVTFERFPVPRNGWRASNFGASSMDWDPDDSKGMKTVGPGVRENRVHIDEQTLDGP